MTLGPRTIDDYLDDLTYQWGRLPEVALEIDSWPDYEQIDFVMEWPIQEDGLEMLAELMASDTPTPDQRRRYADLLRLVEQNHPIFDALSKGDPVPGVAEHPRSHAAG